MPFDEILSISFYCAILFGIGFISLKKEMSSNDYLIGGRSMNYWLTALAAHASDMSSWLFMAFPMQIYLYGMFDAWSAIGLTVFMYLNWQFVAPKVRTLTEKYNSLTFSSFFESRFNDKSGVIRIFTAIMSLCFFTVYISAGLVGLGLVVNSLFNVDYYIAITVGVFVVIPYLFIGGYRTLAYIDLFQGMFLLVVIVGVPLYALHEIGGFNVMIEGIKQKDLSLSLFPAFDGKTFLGILNLFAGWGIGYFGQPHIVTKFMGISDVKNIPKAKYVGITWQIIALTAATLVGLVGIAFFPKGLADPQLIFVRMVRELFNPMLSAFVLCAGLAATISTMDSQILVLASSLTEDFYKRVFRKGASSKELLWTSRTFVMIVSAIAYVIAFLNQSTIYDLVLYAWSGLGASFGPLLLFSLYSKRVNKFGAWAGILVGGTTAATWNFLSTPFDPLLPGFVFSCIAIWLFSFIKPKGHVLQDIEREVTA